MKKPFFDLTGKVILITGAGGHLGSAIAVRLAKAGAYVYLNGRSEDKLKKVEQDIEDNDGKCSLLAFDITDESAVRDAVAIIKKEHGRLDGLVNNAFLMLTGGVDDATMETFQKSFETNVSALFYLSQQCLPLMERMNGESFSSIVNIASMYGVVSPDPSIYGNSGMNNPPFYGATKAAIIQLSRYFAGHVTNRGIRTNSISPGPFPPEDINNSNPAFHAALCKKTPMDRTGNPEEVAAAVHFLLSNDASYINGINLPVDGGWTAW